MRERQTSEGLLIEDELYCKCGWAGHTPVEVIKAWQDRSHGERLVEFDCPECGKWNEVNIVDW